MDGCNDYEALVDGHAVDVGSLMFHYQDDPYPGGMRYRLRVSDPEIVSRLEQKYGIGLRTNLDQPNTSFIFGAVNLAISFNFLAMNRMKYANGICAWINTIQRMEVGSTEVVLYGEGSPHVGSQKDTSVQEPHP